MNHSSARRILIIEDESHIAEALKLNLSMKDYEVIWAPDGMSGLDLWKKENPDLIVLDIMLPGIDGFSVLQRIRLEDEKLPVLILSAKTEPADKVKGLSCGVDDYLTKPFDLEEFLLRVERLLTRSAWSKQQMPAASVPSVYSFGGNTINFDTLQADCRMGLITLTEQEATLLKLFIANQGKNLSRKQLLEIGWGYTGGTTTRTIDNFIVRLRKYFEKNPKKPRHFQSVRAVGYLFDPDPGK
ncbi:MAG: response regulator transcription factor [Thermodesulfobacteriota bacterium]